MVADYRLRLMFEWGGGCIWAKNDAARSKYGVGPIEDLRPLSNETRRKLADMTAWHDLSLNWDYPPDPGPWDAPEYERFEAAASMMLDHPQAELEEGYFIIYERLGFYDARAENQ